MLEEVTIKKQASQLTEDEIEWLRETSKQNFYFFAKFVLEFVFEESWLQKHIHKPICDVLQEYEKNNRVTVVLPRSWLKSTLCSVYYPIWRAIRNPNVRVLIVQNSAPNAEKKLVAIRGQFDGNPLLRLLFPELLPDAQSTWTTRALCLKRPITHPECTFEAAGTRSRLTSRHYDLIIEDDTVSPDLDEMTESNVVPTKDDIGQAIGFHQQTTGLLVDYTQSMLMIVGTRWFELDLISWNQKNEPHYTRIERAVREIDGYPDPKGEITYPERFGGEVLTGLERSWGPYLFSCLYLNSPLRSSDMVFHKDWFIWYSDAPRNLVTYTTVDPVGGTIGKKKKGSSDLDFNVVMTVGKDMSTGLLYVLDYTRFKGSPGDLIDHIFKHQKLWGSHVVGIEGQQYQNSLDYFVKEQMPKRNQFFMLEMLKSVKAKEARIRALQPLFASGTFRLKTHHIELISELEAFPLGAHDDVADALSMVLQLLAMTDGDLTERDATERDPFSLDYFTDLHIASCRVNQNDITSEVFQSTTSDDRRSWMDQAIESTGGFTHAYEV